MFSNIKSDIKAFENHHGKGLLAKFYYPMFTAVLFIRFQSYLYQYKILRPLSYIIVRLNDFFFGIWVGPKVEIGEGLFLAHARGLVVNPNTKVGKNCVILQRVTLGGPNIVIGDNVEICAGAQIISKRNAPVLNIGNNAVIGAGAVVLNSVEAGTIVVGYKAKALDPS